jgi:hypothetical protein
MLRDDAVLEPHRRVGAGDASEPAVARGERAPGGGECLARQRRNRAGRAGRRWRDRRRRRDRNRGRRWCRRRWRRWRGRRRRRRRGRRWRWRWRWRRRRRRRRRIRDDERPGHREPVNRAVVGEAAEVREGSAVRGARCERAGVERALVGGRGVGEGVVVRPADGRSGSDRHGRRRVREIGHRDLHVPRQAGHERGRSRRRPRASGETQQRQQRDDQRATHAQTIRHFAWPGLPRAGTSDAVPKVSP